MEGEEGVLAVDKAFTLMAEAPSPLPARQHKHKSSGCVSQLERIERGLTLEAFSPTFDGEPETARLARAAAANTCWDAMAANIQVLLHTWQLLPGPRANRLAIYPGAGCCKGSLALPYPSAPLCFPPLPHPHSFSEWPLPVSHPLCAGDS